MLNMISNRQLEVAGSHLIWKTKVREAKWKRASARFLLKVLQSLKNQRGAKLVKILFREKRMRERSSHL
jgi:hypothetical protein